MTEVEAINRLFTLMAFIGVGHFGIITMYAINNGDNDIRYMGVVGTLVCLVALIIA